VSVVVREALVLAGGLATRLGDAAADVPKCLQPVAGRPFLDHILWDLHRKGVRRVILCTGRLHDEVAAHVGDGSAFDVEAVYSREPDALGTAGALALAAPFVMGDVVFALNGDSLCDCNLAELALRLRASDDADGAVALSRVTDSTRFGSVTLGAGSRIDAFLEKGAAGTGLVNAGVYCLRTAWLRSLPVGPSSLEQGVFPWLAAGGRLLGMPTDAPFADIGTPESLAAAQASVAAWRRKPCAFLDRDGVINYDVGYLCDPGQFEFTPGMPEAIRLLNDSGWLVIVITNQAGIGRGKYTEQDFLEFTAWIDDRLAEGGAHVDAVYHCPYHATAGVGEYRRWSECRKPEPGMVLQAIADWEPDVERSFMLGDKDSDVAAGEGAGVRGILYTGGDLSDVVRSLIE
jgi:D-glycero-D-manno-heptose 1,7-bisphosphate phosphatase